MELDKTQNLLHKSYKSRKIHMEKFHYETARSLTSLVQNNIVMSNFQKSQRYLEKALFIRLFGEMNLEQPTLLILWGYSTISEAI